MRAMLVLLLALTLLVARVRADDPHDALAADDLALLAPRLDRWTNLHACDSPLLEPVRDPAPREVVGGQLDLDPVAGQDPDEIHPHLAGDVGQHAMAVFELDPEHRIRQGLDYCPLDLDRVVLRLLRLPLFHLPPSASHQAASRVSTSGPESVTATVSSKWAARLPSSVTAVQWSASPRTPQCPIVTIGSIASTMPDRRTGPLPGSPKFGIWGSSWRARPMPWPTKARTTPYPAASTCRCTAAETSPSRWPGRTWAMARSSASRVTSSSRWTAGGTSPTGSVTAASA